MTVLEALVRVLIEVRKGRLNSKPAFLSRPAPSGDSRTAHPMMGDIAAGRTF
jgi:hypothetical protein